MTPLKRLFIALSLIIFLTLFASCNNSVVTPTKTLVPTASSTATTTSTSTPTATPSVTPSVTPSPTTPPSPTIDPNWISLDNDWLQLYYPKDWNIDDSDCVSGSDACLIRLVHVDSNTLNIQLTILPPMGASSDVVQADKEDWDMREISAMIVGAGDLLKLVSVDEMEVDGLRAIKRLYEYPLVDMVTRKVKDTQYNYRVLFVFNDFICTFELQTTNKAEFESYLDEAGYIVDTISFHQ